MGPKSFMMVFLFLFCSNLFAGNYYKVNYYPSLEEAKKLSDRAHDNVLEVCCYMPEKKDIEGLKQSSLSELIIKAGYFPTANDLAILDSMNIPYTLLLSEVFPSPDDIALLNNSHVKLLHILSKDFPTMGEVEVFNQFKIPVRFDSLKMRLPTVKEMVVIKAFKPEITTAFYNNKVPGPGHADFFNALKTKKVFVVLEQFPWGIDAEGFALLKDASLEIDPSELLMPQDVFYLNQFNTSLKLNLREIGPVGTEWIANVKAIKANIITVDDDGTGVLLKPEYTEAMSDSKTPVMFKFGQYY